MNKYQKCGAQNLDVKKITQILKIFKYEDSHGNYIKIINPNSRDRYRDIDIELFDTTFIKTISLPVNNEYTIDRIDESTINLNTILLFLKHKIIFLKKNFTFSLNIKYNVDNSRNEPIDIKNDQNKKAFKYIKYLIQELNNEKKKINFNYKMYNIKTIKKINLDQYFSIKIDIFDI